MMRPLKNRMTALAALVALAAWVAILALGGANAPNPQSASAEEHTTGVSVGLAHPEENFPTLGGSRPIFILVLGSGARPPEPPERGLADSIHIVSYNPELETGSILGFPRDSWVPIPGHGTSKINNAMAWGGPELMIQTIEDLTGIHINYYMVTGFEGFQGIINDIGKRITVVAPYEMHDPLSKANFKKGRNTVNGHNALGFTRNRYDVPNGDFSRSSNQGIMLLAILAQFRKEFKTDPSVFLKYLAAGLRNVKTDIPYDQLVTLGLTSRLVNPKAVANVVAAGTIGEDQGLSTVHLSPSNKRLYNEMKDDGVLPRRAQGAPV